jgi:hypothetical protein
MGNFFYPLRLEKLKENGKFICGTFRDSKEGSFDFKRN